MIKQNINTPNFPDYDPDSEPVLTMDELLDLASNLEEEPDAAYYLVTQYENTDVQKVVNDFDGLENRLACETRDHNELKRKHKFLADTLEKIQITLNVDSYKDILPAIEVFKPA